jgi:hypothetical protein
MGLPWIRMDTGFFGNDKITDLVDLHGSKGKQAGFIYLCALGYSGAYETDGLIKKSSLKIIHGTPGDAAVLVQAGLWLVADGGWLIKNYGTRQVVGAAQQVISESKSAAGKKGAEARWHPDEA